MNKNMTENTNNNVVSKEPNLPTQKVMPTPLPNNSLNQTIPIKSENNSLPPQMINQNQVVQPSVQNQTVTQYNNQMPSQVVPSYPQNMQPTISQNNRTQPVERTSNNMTPNSNLPNKTEKEEIEENSTKKMLRKIFIYLIFIGLILAAAATYLLVDDNNKYKNYIVTVADLIDYDKVEKGGLVYYRGNYKYKIKRKEYFYTPKELTQNTPAKIIQLKYNSKNPNKVYEKGASKYFFIILFTGLGLSFISGSIVIALTSSKTKKIITIKVIEQVNCVGGKRIYLENINETQENEKYYVYFTNNQTKFALGNYLNLNIFEYGETFTTENYKNISAKTIYEFKDKDFTLLPQQVNKND